MKQLFTLIGVLCTLLAIGQSQRTILVEHYTQASCPPCATVNPVVFPVLEANKDKVAVIAYQVYWPGYDPMYEHNPAEVRARVTYYGVRSAPNTVMNGGAPEHSSSAITSSNINTLASKPSPFDLELEVDPFVNFQGLDITLNMEASQNVSGNLVAHVVVVEEDIHFSSPPGTTSEKDFHYVMKKMLPNSGGTTIASDWKAGDSDQISFQYEFENFYDWMEAGVVAFIQDDNSKEVHQAVYWKPDFEANPGDDVLVTDVSASGMLNAEYDVVCGGSTSPVISIMNSGTEVLTSCEIDYSINGSSTATYTWNGNLGKFEETLITLPSIDFPIQVVGEMNVEAKQPNGNEDLYPDNGKVFSELLLSPNSTTKATFTIRPVIRPEELSFKIFDDNDEIILEDGPFNSRGEKTYDLSLEANTCYRISIRNNYRSVNGTFKIENERGENVLTETIQEQGVSVSEFGTFNSVSNKDLTQ
ncbi:MAG: Omp28-related outer membrane protein, partial [Saprospiraceae bacterium]|nr:Omp28-related outer membrane protein [Saprospiraceae bacterium]